MNLSELELDLIDRCIIRRWYRIIRIVMYAPQSSPYAATGMCQGFYGKSRAEAKEWLMSIAHEISWLNYLGSK